MIEDPGGRIDYDATGDGPVIVFVPGSCSTGAAWRPVISALGHPFRCVTTSLPGYGGTAERRLPEDPSISHVAEAVECVIRRAGDRVHLVGHSFGGLVSLAVALRGRVSLASLTTVEAPAAELLRTMGEAEHYRAFQNMTTSYFAAFRSGNTLAIASMIDFYGGQGTFDSWPPRVRAYAVETTAVNIRDWASAFGFALSAAILGTVSIPVLVIRGGASHPAVQRANELLSAGITGATLVTLPAASHFMIATHAGEVAASVRHHILSSEGNLGSPTT